jgi:hypothetical protein
MPAAEGAHVSSTSWLGASLVHLLQACHRHLSYAMRWGESNEVMHMAMLAGREEGGRDQ